MPPLPDVTETIQDGALGIVADSTDNIPLLLGVSSLGTANVIQSVATKAALVAALGSGPLVDAAALVLDTAGGPVYCCPIAPSTQGAAGAVTKNGTGTAVMSVTGNALDQYDVQVIVTKAGANLAAATAAFKYTLDGGDNWSPEIAVPTAGNYALPGTGLTITFADGTFVANDTYKFTATAPSYSVSDLQTTMTAVLADPREWNFVHVIGAAGTVAGAASMLAALDTIMSSAASNFRWAFAVMEAPQDTDANLISGFAASTSKRVMVGAGYAEVMSPVNGLIRKRSAAWPIVARLAKIPIHEHPGRVNTGPVVGVASLYRDEQATPGLDAARFATLRTIIGKQGYYVTRGRMMAPTGSDFSSVQNRRVMDKACKVVRDALLRYLNDSVRLQAAGDPIPGAIAETEARAIEADVGGQLNDALVAAGHASSASVVIDRTHNIASDSTMPVTVRVQPLGYAEIISVDIGFTNPALQAQ